MSSTSASYTKQQAPSPSEHRVRPVRPGISVGHYEITAGTLGAFVRLENARLPRILSKTTCWPTRTGARPATRSSNRVPWTVAGRALTAVVELIDGPSEGDPRWDVLHELAREHAAGLPEDEWHRRASEALGIDLSVSPDAQRTYEEFRARIYAAGFDQDELNAIGEERLARISRIPRCFATSWPRRSTADSNKSGAFEIAAFARGQY